MAANGDIGQGVNPTALGIKPMAHTKALKPAELDRADRAITDYYEAEVLKRCKRSDLVAPMERAKASGRQYPLETFFLGGLKGRVYRQEVL